MRAMLAIIIPASVGLLLLAKPAVALFSATVQARRPDGHHR